MKPIVYLFFSFFIFTSYAQFEKPIEKKKQPTLSIDIHVGPYVQMLEADGISLANTVSSSGGISLNYNLGSMAYLRTGYTSISQAPFEGLSYDAHKIPIIIGLHFLPYRLRSTSSSLYSEFGVYYKQINEFNNNTDQAFSTSNPFGFHLATGVKHEISSKLFAFLQLRGDFDFDNIIENNEQSIKMKRAIMIEFGFGINIF